MVSVGQQSGLSTDVFSAQGLTRLALSCWWAMSSLEANNSLMGLRATALPCHVSPQMALITFKANRKACLLL
jgi:hypothetical protein